MDKLKFYGYQKQKDKLQKLFLMLSVGILCFAMTGQAFAGCKNPNLLTPEWKSMVWRSADARLRDHYDRGTCKYIKGPHPGGDIPLGLPHGALHVTVIAFGYGACHVFSYEDNNGYYITTCR